MIRTTWTDRLNAIRHCRAVALNCCEHSYTQSPNDARQRLRATVLPWASVLYLVTRRQRRGLTVIECLFAMTIVIIGLFGMAFMVRFAGRQAADSYRITQALGIGDNAVAFANSNQVFQPSLTTPWLIVDDRPTAANDSSLYFGTMERLHSARYAAGNPSGLGVTERARLANAVLGSGFCMDPLFWGNQMRYAGIVRERSWENIRRASFPFYHEQFPQSFDPFDSSGGTAYTPRMTRVSVHDPSAGVFGGWLKLPASRQLAQVSGGDLTVATPEQDRSLSPIRNMVAGFNGGELLTTLQGTEANSSSTWLATIVPSEDTPIVEPSMVPSATSGLPFLPELYELSVVVIAKRDVRELALMDSTAPSDFAAAYTSFKSQGVPPSSERLLSVSFPNTTEAQTSGTFEVLLSADATVSSNMKVGDWLMLSRETYAEPVDDRLSRRSRHKWYRVISVDAPQIGTGPTGNTIFSREVRVSGAPWGWTTSELEKMQRAPNLPPPAFPQTVATLIPNVVNVYQRTYRVSN